MPYSYMDVITLVGNSIPRMNGDASSALFMDQVNSAIWNFADWRFALAKMAPFYVVPLVQDYVAPYIALPSDFAGLRAADLVHNASEPPVRYPPLTIDRYLPLTHWQDRTRAVSFEATTGGIRIHPRPPAGIGPMDYQIECTYKQLPTRVTADRLMSSLPGGDQYFQVWVDGAYWFAKRQPQDYQLFQASLVNMANNEAVNLGQQSIAPAEPLVSW